MISIARRRWSTRATVIRPLEGICVKLLDPAGFLVGQRTELWDPRPQGEAAGILLENLLQQLDMGRWHIDDLLHGIAELVERFEKADLAREVFHDGLFHARIEKLGMRGGVEKAVEVDRLVKHLDSAFLGLLPFDLRK
ncbi:hypothetical protein FHS96_005579 [Sphingomonas zeicaulis]